MLAVCIAGARRNSVAEFVTVTSALDIPAITRILDAEPVPSLAAYLESGGGKELAAARALGPDATIDEVTAAGVRGRDGAGFPTGEKWRTVAADASGPRHHFSPSEGETRRLAPPFAIKTS